MNPLTTHILSTLFNELWSIAMSKLEDSTNDSIRVLKKATCASLSRKSKLTYHVGVDSDDEIYLRVHSNDGGGFHSREWLSMKDIQAVMEEHPPGTPVTSILLQPLFHGKSVNTPAFLLAALAHEKLMYPMKGKKRSLEPAVDFTEKVSKLMASKATARKAPTSSKKKTATKKTVTKKAIIKKKAMARKKTTTRKKTT
jgi:hypothetical protein